SQTYWRRLGADQPVGYVRNNRQHRNAAGIRPCRRGVVHRIERRHTASRESRECFQQKVLRQRRQQHEYFARFSSSYPDWTDHQVLSVYERVKELPLVESVMYSRAIARVKLIGNERGLKPATTCPIQKSFN